MERVFTGIAIIAGGLVMSQGFSFALWNQHQGVGSQITEHAILIGAVGTGLFLLALSFARAEARLTKIQQQLEELQKDKKG